MERTLKSRIGIRLLVEQQVALHNPREGYCGVFSTRVSPRKASTSYTNKQTKNPNKKSPIDCRKVCRRRKPDGPLEIRYSALLFQHSYALGL
jgi:hypothetical protein